MLAVNKQHLANFLLMDHSSIKTQQTREQEIYKVMLEFFSNHNYVFTLIYLFI